MPSQSLRNRDASSLQPPLAPINLDAVMAGAGEVAFEWNMGTDDLVWGERVATVLGISADRIATGRAFAALFDPQTRGSRNDVILNARGVDDGSGIRYETQYALLTGGDRGRRVIVEEAGRWFADAKGRAVRVAGVVRVINGRHEREQRIQFLARYDELTGHLNTPALLSVLGDVLNGATKAHTTIAFMVLAVDDFRAINEAYGFDFADQVFAAVAQRIKATLRDGDTIGRFGGNKIGVVLRNCADGDMPLAAERFQAIARNEVITIQTGSVAVTVSCGGVTLPRHGRTPGEAVTRAQEALDAARLAGPGRFVAYRTSKEFSDRRRANASASTDLVSALKANAFVLAHQPVVVAKTRGVAFSEAVLRIGRSEGTTTVPLGAAAGNHGLVRLIDDHALQLVLAALEGSPQARVALGVSADTVADADWLAKASARLGGRPALARRMIVAIPESVLVQGWEAASRFAGMLRDAGCAIAIYDFGAGTASVKVLRELNVDFVKLEGTYMENLAENSRDRVVAKALVDVAKAFGVKTIAARVTSEVSAAMLAELGVDYLQGALIGEPVAGPPSIEQGA